MRKRIGIVTYNKYCNFTNYGSALQSWALWNAINDLGYECLLVDYCPEILKDKNPLNPFEKMWVKDSEVLKDKKEIMKAIKINFDKFSSFYNKMAFTKKKYDKNNFNSIVDEVDSFVCGGDTIFCIEEYGFDPGYYAEYLPMKNNSISFSASFGDSNFIGDGINELKEKISNFKALGIREGRLIDTLKELTIKPVKRVIDNTLLVERERYEELIGDIKPVISEPYLLYYSRFYNKEMEDFAIKLAKDKGLKIIEISLRQTNKRLGHINCYEAGVEEFLSLVKYSQYVVSNSYHAMIFSVIFNKEFYCFPRVNCLDKFRQFLSLVDLNERLIEDKHCVSTTPIDYIKVNNIIEKHKKDSIDFLKEELAIL